MAKITNNQIIEKASLLSAAGVLFPLGIATFQTDKVIGTCIIAFGVIAIALRELRKA